MSDPKKTIKEYLAKNGYPLEMFVAKQFQLEEFEVYQSSIYVDKETGKDREVDVAAYYVRYYGDIQFSFKIIIECKYAVHPWILFSGEHPGFKDMKVDSLYGSNNAGGKLLTELAQIPEFCDSLPFRIQQKLSYGLVEANPNGKQDEGRTTYKAIMTLLNALQYEKEIPKNGKIVEFYIPVIVVQGKLFECYLDHNDEEVINEIQEGQLLYKSNVFPNVFPVIEIITRDKVRDLANKIGKDLWSIFNTHFGQTKNLIDNFPSEGPSVW
jgi:hypothetical protein